MTFSRYFLSDYVLAPIIAMNFVGFRAIAHRFTTVVSLSGPIIRFLAGFTLSLYLFHQPLLLFFAALIDGDPNGYWFYAQIMTCVLIAVFVIGSFTEKKKGFYRLLATHAVTWALRLKWRWYSATNRNTH